MALQSIFGDDCEVLCDVAGETSFALQIALDFGIGDEPVLVSVDAPDLPLDSDGAEGGATASAGAAAHDQQVGRKPPVSVLDLAREKMYNSSSSGAAAPAPACARTSSGRPRLEVSVKRLPPLTLQVSLPAKYPSEESPVFHLACLWLTAEQLARLCAEMDERASPGMPVVFAWADMLRSEAAEILGLSRRVHLVISEPVADERAVAECTDLRSALMEVLEYDRKLELEIWRQEVHCCGICFSDKPGSQFTHLGGCEHSFCKECVGEMAKIFVSEGTIVELRCPDPKCRKEMAPSALQEVLGDEAYQRWERLKMQQILTSELKGVVFCPRCEEHNRETPVMAREPTAEGEAPLAECPHCGYVFCGSCLSVYHESTNNCAPPEERAALAAIRREQARGGRDPAEKRRLERLARGYVIEIAAGEPPLAADVTGHLTEERGKGKIGDQIMSVSQPGPDKHRKLWVEGEDAVEALGAALAVPPPLQVRCRAPNAGVEERSRSRRVLEELLSLRALAKDSQQCPSCHATIQRSEGCNHMTCSNCRTHFCYRCGKTLDPEDPYAHFRNSACPTFDNAEVERMREEERRVAAGGPGQDRELERLQRQFGNQQELFAAFQAGHGNQQRRRLGRAERLAAGETMCPTCGHWNGRTGGMNNCRCPYCRTPYCHHCHKRIQGVISLHYTGAQACPRHWRPDPA